MIHVYIDGQTRGPYVLDQIRSMWASGIITADAVYWDDNGESWKPVLELLSDSTGSLLVPEEHAEVVTTEGSLAPASDDRIIACKACGENCEGPPNGGMAIGLWDSHRPRPWRRLWARFLDFQILGGIPASLLAPIWLYLFPHVEPSTVAGIGFVSILATEPLCLAHLGNTPGKWLLGILLRKSDGSRLSEREGARRFRAVFWRFFVLVFPFCALFAYRDLKKWGSTKWDREGGFIVTYSPICGARWFASMSLVVVFVAGYAIGISELMALDREQTNKINAIASAAPETNPPAATALEASTPASHPVEADADSPDDLVNRMARGTGYEADVAREIQKHPVLGGETPDEYQARLQQWLSRDASIKASTGTPQNSASTPSFPAQDSAEWQSRNNAARAQVIADYPSVAIAGSALNTAFVAEYNRCKANNPAFTEDPEFPLAIIETLQKTPLAQAPQQPAAPVQQPPLVAQESVASPTPKLTAYQQIFGPNTKMQGSMLDQPPESSYQQSPEAQNESYQTQQQPADNGYLQNRNIELEQQVHDQQGQNWDNQVQQQQRDGEDFQRQTEQDAQQAQQQLDKQ